jgi:hypothetical protein
MRFLLIPAIFLAGAVCGNGQTAHAEYTGQHWVGLLVSASCDSQAKAAHSAAEEARATTTGRTTTPAVDVSGTRGQASVNETADRTAPTASDVPRTGDVFATASGKVQDRTWPQARKQAAALDSACRVGAGTNQFALLLPDGRKIPFDERGNETIMKQLAATHGGVAKPTIFRVAVAGKLEQGRIAVDTVRF